MHAELYLVIYRQVERELERDLARLVTMRDRPQDVVPPTGLRLRERAEALVARTRTVLVARQPAPQVVCCPA